MSTLTVTLPWPDRALSPNGSHGHWSVVSRARKEARQQAYYAAKEAYREPLKPPVTVTMTFHPPDKRRRDLDNLVSMCKPYQDSIFSVLLMDDCHIRSTTAAWGEVVRFGRVVIEVREAEG